MRAPDDDLLPSLRHSRPVQRRSSAARSTALSAPRTRRTDRAFAGRGAGPFPNLEINLFLVAPDERQDKVEQEIRRPTFALRDKPLAHVCGFISFSKLMEKLAGIRKLGLANSLKPDFLQKTAEYYSDAEEE